MNSWWTSNRIAALLLVFVVVLLQLLIAFQGFDICDEGLSLTFFQQFYNAPESVEYNFVYWFSGLIGGLWYEMYENGGILWFRFFTIIINMATFFVAYKLLVKYVNKWHALIGLTMVLFINDYGYLAFYHNHLTALLSICAIYALHQGLVNNKLKLITLSGCIVAINVFTRLPNATFFIVVLAIPFYIYFLQKFSILKAVKPILYFGLGSLLGFAMVFGLLLIFNQFEIMKLAIAGGFDLGNAADSSHNFGSLLRMYIYNYTAVFKSMAKFILTGLLLFGLTFIARKHKSLYVIWYAMAIALFAYNFKVDTIFPIYGLMLISTYFLLVTKQPETIKLLVFLTFCMAFFLPFGSDGGIYNIGYMSVWLVIPLFIHSVLKGQNKWLTNRNYGLGHIMLAMVLGFFFIQFYKIFNEAYFDGGSRLEKTYVIKSDMAKHIYTTKERADIVNDLLVNLDDFVDDDDYLLAYDKIPMIHFLTKTRPYVHNPWPWIYDSSSFERHLKRGENEIDVLPIIVQQKFETIVDFEEPVNDYMAEGKVNDSRYNAGRTKAMNDFIKRNDYTIVWSNSHFNIYKSIKK